MKVSRVYLVGTPANLGGLSARHGPLILVGCPPNYQPHLPGGRTANISGVTLFTPGFRSGHNKC